SRQLKGWGALVTEADSGAQALSLLEQGASFDLAILDLHMPEMDGAMLASRIRESRDCMQMPLVLLSSLGMRPSCSINWAAVLSKPVRPKFLYEALRRVF